jgi:hypothetical protein
MLKFNETETVMKGAKISEFIVFLNVAPAFDVAMGQVTCPIT